jgi:hypothetical protein
MPALANMTLNGLAGADHVFKPYNVIGGLVTWINAGTAPVSDERFTFSSVRTPTGRVKVVMKLDLPKSQDVEIGGVTKPIVVRKAYVTLTIDTDSTAPEADRYEILDLLRSLVSASDNLPISTAVVENGTFY